MEVLAISLGRNILNDTSRDRSRMKQYAEYLDEYHIAVLTRKEHGYKDNVHDGPLHLYPTNSSSRIMMLVDAFFLAKKIIRDTQKTSWVISAQDPLEIGWLSWLISYIKNIRLHVQVHGDYFSSDSWAGHSLIQCVRRFFALVLLRHAPAIRVVSLRIRASLIKKGVPEERITVLPIRPELESFLHVDHVYRTKPPFTLLSLGRLSHEKDISRIVEAFALVHEKRKDVTLKIVGKGNEEINLITLIKELNLSDAVRILPWTENVPDEMNNADIFLLASKHEAYALTLIEAMAVGLPVVTTDVGCVGEVVKHHEHGIVVGDESIESYADAILKLIENPDQCKKYGMAGRVTAQKLAQTSGEEYIQAWVTVLSGGSVGV